ncbi:MAG: hypothetical protein AAF798_01645 [Bacteroidota bacterium]
MAIHDVDGILSHLEEGYENELSFLASTGVEVYSTADLIRLKGQWQVKNHFFYLLQRRLIRLAAYSPAAIVIGGLLYFAVGWIRLGLFISSLFPLSWMLIIFGFYFLKTSFRGQGHLEWVGQAIDDEIAKRKTKSK